MIPLVPFGSTMVAFDAAAANATAYLKQNMPPFDQPVTLFGLDGGVDGLDVGVASAGVNQSLEAKMKYAWAADVDQATFNEYVASYAFSNEPRTDWRGLLADKVEAIVANSTTIEDAAIAINQGIWDGVVFKSSMTPLIFDPVSTLAYGYASCTGISAVYVAALRTAGIPARVAGTPAWKNDPSNGNHNWVEIYRPGIGWNFIEGQPAGGGETLDNPCDKWFCGASHFPTTANNQTKVYAARFDQLQNSSYYAMAWDPSNYDVPGDDRSDYYTSVCSKC